MKRSFSNFGILSASIAILVTAAVGSGGTARAQGVTNAMYACERANGEIKLVTSVQKCSNKRQTLLGGVVLTRLSAVVSPAGTAQPGDAVPFQGVNVGGVFFQGGGRYCVIPANAEQFNLSVLDIQPAAFVRPQSSSTTVSSQQRSNACIVVAGGPSGFHVQIFDGVDGEGQPAPTNDVGFVIQVP